ncbi:small RNA degrading nuclease 1-like isoform X1 [Cucurbita maxima]|uniref:Small RNA degrading nuclease 1-like isoform X1 n=1 Tax=Cucurbita maxima TaxID=3661 RepID=A0A6J1KSG2_CUCMA|nr:small RNA degrading nuclease 1-like isoform X1 [Cucurbita maxima]
MEDKIVTAEKTVLVEMVRLAQKRGMKGREGDWKEFLKRHDPKFGSSLSDPYKRPNDLLIAFLKTFSKEDDLMFLDKVLQCNEKRNFVKQVSQNASDNESPEQRLVRLTLEHPQYSMEYSFPSFNEGWIVTKFSQKSEALNSNSIYAIDCEMVLCEDGTENLVRVCMVDRDLQVKIDELVKPRKEIKDYRTDITGISPGDLDDVTCSLVDVQKSITKLLSSGTILVGHSLNNDLRALQLDHARVIDTSYIFKYFNGSIYRRPSLNNLCKSVLGYDLRQEGAPHNCLDDARAAMKLALAKLESKVDDVITEADENTPQIGMEKLLLHRIPVNVSSEELAGVISGDFTIELKPPKNVQGGDIYSAFAIFKNPKEAHEAFEQIEGSQNEDSSGRPQKLIRFQRSGTIVSIYVRKMGRKDFADKLSSTKRDMKVIENLVMSKKQKTDQNIGMDTISNSSRSFDHVEEVEMLNLELKQDSSPCCDHLNEVERLKEELRRKDYELSNLRKAITALKKKNEKKKGKKK